MQFPQIPIEIIWVVVAAIICMTLAIYWIKFEKPHIRARDMLKGLYYDPEKFRKRTVAQTFTYYDAKISKIVFAFCVPVSIAVILPAIFIPAPYNFVITMAGVFVSLFMVMYFKKAIDDEEKSRNINKPFGTCISHYPETGDNNELWRRMENEGEIQLDGNQKETVVDQLLETAKELPSFDMKKNDLDELKKDWVKRMENMRVYRLRVADDFRILFVTPHTMEESKTQGTRPMIDETVHVDVQQVPMFNLYAGTTRKLFRSRDDKDRPVFMDKTMGIYVNLYDIKSRDDDMMGGGHTVLSKTDTLLGEIMHLYEQKQTSAKEMTKTLRDLEKTSLDYEEADFDSKAEAHRITQGVKGIVSAMGSFSRPSRTKTDGAIVITLVVVFTIFGVVLGFTWGLIAALGAG